MQKRFVIICSYLVKVLPTSDQFYLIMLDNLYACVLPSKYNSSNGRHYSASHYYLQRLCRAVVSLWLIFDEMAAT